MKIKSVIIGIAGCGGLGSNCANSLVRSGFKNLVLVDFDKVERSNLNRQFYFRDQIGKNKVDCLKENLLRINSDLQITTYLERIEKENILDIFKQCKIVVEAFDKAEYKSLLVETLLPHKELIVSASGLAGYGNSDDIKVHWIKDNLVIIGDRKSEVSLSLPPLSPRVNVAAAKQADMILEYVLSKG